MLFDLLTRDAVGFTLRWRDDQGVLHAAEGAHTTDKPGGFVMWTRCEGTEFPPEEAWSGGQPLTCRHCAAIEHGERLQVLASDAVSRNAGGLTFGSHRPG
jgi:hypothetical protein